MEQTIHLRGPPESDTLSRTKSPPKTSNIPVPFDYAPAVDGTDENLLILLHGLGDTQIPFAKLGRQLKLPQTAVLAIRAPERVPFLYEDAFQWYPSFDNLGELIDRPNPTLALDMIAKILQHLTRDCLWPPHRIHLFGFAQGGSVAAESVVKWWRLEKEREGSDANKASAQALGSVVSVCGPMLSYPTLSKMCPTPLLVFHRPPPAETALASGALVDFRRAYETVAEVRMVGEGMPRSRDEWGPIMGFWAKNLGRRQVGGLYEVLGGTAA